MIFLVIPTARASSNQIEERPDSGWKEFGTLENENVFVRVPTISGTGLSRFKKTVELGKRGNSCFLFCK